MTEYEDDVASADEATVSNPAPVSSVEVGAPVESGESVSEEIGRLLLESQGQISDVARCLEEGIDNPSDIVAAGAAANTGAVSNLIQSIRAIRDGELPRAPSVAQKTLHAARSFRRQHAGNLSQNAIDHLNSVIADLGAVITDPSEIRREDEQLRARATELEHVLDTQGGVYVYTFPHYRTYPTVEGTQRTLLKVGHSAIDAVDRVKTQVRGPWVPEQPLILRVYRQDYVEPRELERKFHLLLAAADHVPTDPGASGREWFETSIEFLDAVAAVLGLEVVDIEAVE